MNCSLNLSQFEFKTSRAYLDMSITLSMSSCPIEFGKHIIAKTDYHIYTLLKTAKHVIRSSCTKRTCNVDVGIAQPNWTSTFGQFNEFNSYLLWHWHELKQRDERTTTSSQRPRSDGFSAKRVVLYRRYPKSGRRIP